MTPCKFYPYTAEKPYCHKMYFYRLHSYTNACKKLYIFTSTIRALSAEHRRVILIT